MPNARRALLAGSTAMVLVAAATPQARAWPITGPTNASQTLTSGTGSVTSSGTITTGNSAAVTINGAGTLINSGHLTSSVTGGSSAATVLITAPNATITNSGTIIDTASLSGNAISAVFGNSVTAIQNLPGGTIKGATAISLMGGVGDIINGAQGSTTGLISGTHGSGIVIDGTVTGNVTNYGTIVATASALRQYSDGAPGSVAGNIVNSGTISGYQAISAYSIVGSVNNSGLLQGKGVGALVGAINVTSGALSITNSGSIQGGIVDSDPVAGITINGGTASAPGTITGGTIVGKSLTFASGAQVLGAYVNVGSGSGTVTNSGTILTLNTPQTISGSYVQSGSGVLNIGISGTLSSQHGELVVTNAATITGVSLTANSGFHPVVGQVFTIASGSAASSNYAGASPNSGTLGFNLSTLASGGTDYLLATITQVATYGSIGSAAGSTGATMGSVMDQLSGNPTMQGVLTALQNLSPAEQAKALKSLAPSQGSSGATQLMTSSELTYLVSSAIMARTGARFASEQAPTGVAAGSAAPDSNVWGQVLGAHSHRAGDAATDGYSFSSWGLAFGADTKVTDDVLAGAALSWGRGWVSGLNDSAGDANRVDLWQITSYSTWQHGPLYIDGQIGFGVSENLQSRLIPFLAETANAHYSGRQINTKIDGGYAIPLGETKLTPIASMRWLRLYNDSYTETGAGASNLTVSAATADQVEGGLGVKFAAPVRTPMGTIVPEISASWVHDFINGNVDTSAVLGGVSFQTATPLPSPDGALVGASIPLFDNGDVAIKAEYTGEFRTDYVSNAGIIDVKTRF